MQVTFRKRATNYRTLLQKVANEDKASYGSLPPCREIAFGELAEQVSAFFTKITHLLSSLSDLSAGEIFEQVCIFLSTCILNLHCFFGVLVFCWSNCVCVGVGACA